MQTKPSTVVSLPPGPQSARNLTAWNRRTRVMDSRALGGAMERGAAQLQRLLTPLPPSPLLLAGQQNQQERAHNSRDADADANADLCAYSRG